MKYHTVLYGWSMLWVGKNKPPIRRLLLQLLLQSELRQLLLLCSHPCFWVKLLIYTVYILALAVERTVVPDVPAVLFTLLHLFPRKVLVFYFVA